MREPVIPRFDSGPVNQHLGVGSQAGERAAQVFVHLKNSCKILLRNNLPRGDLNTGREQYCYSDPYLKNGQITVRI